MGINFRKIIKKRMKQKGIENAAQLTDKINKYWLTKELVKIKKAGRLPEKIQRITRPTVHRYLKGESEITSANLELIFEVLDVKIADSG